MARIRVHLCVELVRRPSGDPVSGIGLSAVLFDFRIFRRRVVVQVGHAVAVVFVLAHGTFALLMVFVTLRLYVLVTGSLCWGSVV